MLELFSIDYDDVIDSQYLTGRTTYSFAVDNLFPLINKYDSQRKLQKPSFYSRLREDIKKGCIMPSLTLAFLADGEIETINNSNLKAYEEYMKTHIEKAYVLDGIQRLNALYTVSEEEIPNNKYLYLNIIVSKSQDYLLYRMITLNNGQKQMTPRHQIEMLTKGLFDFSKLSNITVLTEKDSASGVIKDSFQFASVVKAYLSFLTEYVNTENAKIISEQMDNIIYNKIMDKGIDADRLKFNEFLCLIDNFCSHSELKKWFKIDNNLIGFAALSKPTYEKIKTLSNDEFFELVTNFEKGFAIINKSKIKVGQIRRELVQEYFNDYEAIKNLDDDSIKVYMNDKVIQ